MTTWTPVEPLTDEPQDSAFWRDPWIPKVGDRVRVRLSGECLVEPPHPLSYHAEFGKGHPAEFNGLVGTIVPLEKAGPGPATRDHPYLVAFDDEDVRVDRISPVIIGAEFAACELEPLS